MSQISFPVCLRWTTEKETPGRGSQSPAFSFQNKSYYLTLYVVSDYYSLFINSQSESGRGQLCNSSVQVENRKGEVLAPLSRKRHNVDLWKTCIWSCGQSDILEVEPKFLAEGVLRFLVVLDNVTQSKPILKEDKSIQTPSCMNANLCLERLSEDFSNLQEEDSKPDVTIIVGDQNVKVHKNILSVRSPVFASMLHSDMLEAKTGLVKVPDMTLAIFKQFLRYLYAGTLTKLTVETAMGLYEAADKYGVEGLIAKCGDFLAENLTPENACEILVLLDAHSDKDFQETVIAYMLQEKIPLKDDLWSDFSEEHPKLANKVLTRFCKLYCVE